MANSVRLFCFLFVLQLVTTFCPEARASEEHGGGYRLPESDLVRGLPGQPDVTFRHYSGYIRLREQDERALFYWFFEAQGGVSEKPLLLWLNGGNAVLNDETDQAGMVDFAWSHAVISDQLYRRVKRRCDFSSENQTTVCNNALSAMLQAYGDIDIYSIYSPVCTATLTKSSLYSSPRLVASPRTFSKHELWHRLPSGVDPCTEEYTTNYLRRKDVQEALHANITNIKYPYKPCSEVIAKWNDAPDSVLPVLRKLMKGGLRVWVYSGDTDGRVPVTSTRYSLNKMQLKEKAAWRAWFHNHQVAGWTVEYEGLTFATLRGAGHQAPVYVPQQALSLLTHFLSASTLPSSRF